MRMEKELLSTEEKLYIYLKENCLPKNYKERISFDRNLFDAGIVDSAGLISFISFMEIEFNLSIPDEDLIPDNFATINAISWYIRKRQEVLRG